MSPLLAYTKRDTKDIKVTLPDGTNFQMSPFGKGNNEEYLIQDIAVKRLLEQKGTIQDIKKVFEVISVLAE